MDKTLAWSCLLVALVSLVLFTAAPWEGGSNKEDLECSELMEEDQDQGKADQFQGGDQVREKQGGNQVRGGQNCVRVRKEVFTNWAGNIRSEGKVVVFYPTTVRGLQAVVRLSLEQQLAVRVVGARHSWSRALLQVPSQTLLVSLLARGELHELSFVGSVVQNGETMAEMEVGSGATLGQIAGKARSEGWQMASAPVIPEVTIGGAVLSLSHGAGTSRLGLPELAESVTALTYVNAKGDVRRLTNKHEVSTFLSSHGLLGIIVSLKISLVPSGRVRAPLFSYSSSLDVFLPRPGKALSQETLHMLENSDNQEFYMDVSGQDKPFSSSALPISGTFWSLDSGAADEEQIVFHWARNLLSLFVKPCQAWYVVEYLKDWFSGERWISSVDALLPYCDRPTVELSKFKLPTVKTAKFRVTEFTFPIVEDKAGERNYSFVQKAVWDALDMADQLKMGGCNGLTDHLDVRLIAPSDIPMAPYPRRSGVWGWAGVVLAAGADIPEADWATFMNGVASVWVKYAYPDGSLVLPRPHWAKEMPEYVGGKSIVEYLQQAYSEDIYKIKVEMSKILENEDVTLLESTNTFATPFVKELFSL